MSWFFGNLLWFEEFTWVWFGVEFEVGFWVGNGYLDLGLWLGLAGVWVLDCLTNSTWTPTLPKMLGVDTLTLGKVNFFLKKISENIYNYNIYIMTTSNICQ